MVHSLARAQIIWKYGKYGNTGTVLYSLYSPKVAPFDYVPMAEC